MAKPAAGFIFDFDGVVVDSISVHLRAWEVATKSLFGLELNNPNRFVGMSTVQIGVQIAQEAGMPASAPELVRLKRAALETGAQTVDALPGTHDLFQRLARSQIAWGIASNANRRFIENTLSHLGLVVPMVCAVEDVRHPKPAPDVFLLCAQRLGISPAEHKRILVFEDSIHGLQAAARAGMFPVGVTTQHAAIDLFAAGARSTCSSLLDAVTGNWLEMPPL